MTKTYEEEVCASGACSKHRSCSAGSSMTDSERTKCDNEVALYNEYDRLKSEKVGMDEKIKTAKEQWYKAAFNNLSRYDADAKREGATKAKEIIKEWKIDFDQIYNSIQNAARLPELRGTCNRAPSAGCCTARGCGSVLGCSAGV